MAGDWIKMRSDLFTHPKVVRMASALKADNLRTIGGLMSAWCLFDAHSVDGSLPGYSTETLDMHLRWPGFSSAMKAVSWLMEDTEGLALPSFDTHNGESAKRRAQDADRKRAVRKLSAPEADKTRTREEKRREEKKDQEISPPPVTKKKPLKTPMPENFGLSSAVRDWAMAKGYGKLDEHLDAFKAIVESKAHTYVNWDAALRNCIRQDWGRVRTIVGGQRQDAPSPAAHAPANPEKRTLTPEQQAANKRHLDEILGDDNGNV
jgi:hypothetical protein